MREGLNASPLKRITASRMISCSQGSAKQIDEIVCQQQQGMAINIQCMIYDVQYVEHFFFSYM